ncbi:hypothetical protein ABZ721_05150 [Streptomyces sp. NPDC006733]|uniref:Rv1733c family protein n=1 Tax=Streptomyces sp. NPDC006733 TaxID=3155460 RepID=UPI0033FD2357
MKGTLRWWRWRSNPLRRRSDIVEGWVNVVTAAVLLLGVPAAAMAAGAAAHDAAVDAAERQRATRHAVSAVLLEDAPALPGYGTTGDRFAVAVRWTTPAGVVATGRAKADAGSARGSTTTVWLDRSGHQVAAPASADQVASWTAIGVTGGAAVALALVITARGAVRRVSDRHRMAEWERDWDHIADTWGRRRT